MFLWGAQADQNPAPPPITFRTYVPLLTPTERLERKEETTKNKKKNKKD
jgi:hypothetical protein